MQLLVSYQVNGGTASEPAWKDVSTSERTVELSAAAPTFLQVRQERGKMEFSGFPRKKMRLVDTFRLTVEPDTGS